MTPPSLSEPVFTEPDALNHQQRISACLERAAQIPAVFTRLYADTALAAAALADKSAAANRPALAGLPVSIKDLLDVAGETTLAGSLVLRDAAPASADAPVVARLRRAGAAIIGKTNMTEFAFSGVGLNPHYGTPANPADALVARIPGGSSSGAAVSVAAGICMAGIGSDTGGSIRIPAALCGLVGFKPTMRRVPVAGTIALAPSLDTICAMTRSVKDCLLIDSVIADTGLNVPALPLAGLRLALPAAVVMADLDAHVAASFAAALSILSAAGATLVELPMTLLEEAQQINRFAPIEAWAWHQTLLTQHGDQYDQRVAKRMQLGANYVPAEITHLHQARTTWITRMEAELSGFDAMLMPTVPIVAPAIANLEASEDAFFDANRLLLRNPSLINLLDGCAISLPCHARGSLPVGLMLAGPAMTDAHLIGVALAVERALQGL